MRFCYYGKDGGAESTVWGFWLIEIKSLFSVVLLRFEDGTRDAYHDHAFTAISWVLRGGGLLERFLPGGAVNRGHPPMLHEPSFRPILTRRQTFHQVESFGRTWVLSFRGPWSRTWHEYRPGTNEEVTLTNGRHVVAMAAGTAGTLPPRADY